jgi:hypothetical protein
VQHACFERHSRNAGRRSVLAQCDGHRW